MTFGENLRRARRAKGLPIRVVADALGVSVAYLSDVELSKRTPLNPSHYPAIAKTLGQKASVVASWANSERCSQCGALSHHALRLQG